MSAPPDPVIVSQQERASGKGLTDVPLLRLLDGITDGEWAEPVDRVRAAQSDKERDRLKKGLPGFTASGVFSERRSKGLSQHSGLVALDYDKVEDAPDLRDRAGALPATLASFITPSGAGVRVLVSVPDLVREPERHGEAYREVAALYDTELGAKHDPACSDVARLSFVSHDPDAVVFTEAPGFDLGERLVTPEPTGKESPLPKKEPKKDEDSARSTLSKAAERVRLARNGERHTTFGKLVTQCAGMAKAGRIRWSRRRPWLQELGEEIGLPTKEVASYIDWAEREVEPMPALTNDEQLRLARAAKEAKRQGEQEEANTTDASRLLRVLDCEQAQMVELRGDIRTVYVLEIDGQRSTPVTAEKLQQKPAMRTAIWEAKGVSLKLSPPMLEKVTELLYDAREVERFEGERAYVLGVAYHEAWGGDANGRAASTEAIRYATYRSLHLRLTLEQVTRILVEDNWENLGGGRWRPPPDRLETFRKVVERESGARLPDGVALRGYTYDEDIFIQDTKLRRKRIRVGGRNVAR